MNIHTVDIIYLILYQIAGDKKKKSDTIPAVR